MISATNLQKKTKNLITFVLHIYDPNSVFVIVVIW